MTPPSSSALRTRVGAPASCHHRIVAGVRLAYTDDGTGPAVVCLHAIGHGAGDFTPLRDHLRDTARVVALDWPGQGRSDPDPHHASAGRYTDLLARFLDDTGLAPVVLIGNSIGGAVAIRYAAAHPARVRGLVLMNPGGLAPLDRTARIAIAAMVRFFSAGVRRAPWFPLAFAAYYRLVLRQPAAAIQRRRIVASAYEIAPVLAQAWESFRAPDADIRHLAPQVGCPVLFAWAAQDHIVQLAASLPAIRRFPDAVLETFPAGHAPQLEAPEAFATRVARFVHDTTANRGEQVVAGV